MKKINPAEFRNPIKILRLMDNKTDEDIPGQEYQILYETKAKVLNVRGQEFALALGNGNKLSSTFYLRYRKDFIITEDDVIEFNGIKHEIKYANDMEFRHIYWELKTEAIK